MQVNGPDGNEQERRRLKQRTVELEAIVDRQREQIRDLHHVAHQFKYPPDVKLLHCIADEIDCDGCENLSVEWDTNASHCRKEEDGECGMANAWALREFARALEIASRLEALKDHSTVPQLEASEQICDGCGARGTGMSMFGHAGLLCETCQKPYREAKP